MNSPTIDIGIDLGTTNSAIAAALDGDIQIIRNNDDVQITPSVIRFLPNGTVQIGRKAYEHHRLNDDGSSFSRFKRQMGKQKAFQVRGNGRGTTSEELAAELLKSLRSDVEGWAGHAVSAAVITVPAMFELAQCEATQRAAAMAGIHQAPLLQEPIAAGLAYGNDRDLSDAYFLVYDLGGGTFDVTLMKVAEGKLTVVGLDGDNFLGGRDWDRKLAGLLAQRLTADGYELWSPADPAGQEFARRLELLAEGEKIQLSRRDQVDVIFDGTLNDANGRPIDAAVRIDRAEYEQLISPDVERSLALLSRLLERQHLPSSAIAHILLVGGPTRTPLLRSMVASLTGISIETRIDPMTVVAEGAARFAASMEREERSLRTVAAGSMTRLELSHPTVTDDTIAHIGGRVIDHVGGVASVELRRADGGWSSGRVPIQSGVFFADVALVARRPNTFEISCHDQVGRIVPAMPDLCTIIQGIAAAEPPLARSVAVVALNSEDEQICRVLLTKGLALPTVAREMFRSVRTVGPGHSDDVLKVHVVEGEYERPDLNRHVGHLSITGNKLDRPLPVNTPIEVTLRIDASRAVSVSAYIPLLDESFEEILTDKVLLDEDPERIRHDLKGDRERIHKLAEHADEDIDRFEAMAQEIDDDILAAKAGDSERADRAARLRKDLANEVDQLEQRSEVPRLIEGVNQALAEAQHVVGPHGDANQQNRLTLLREEAEQAIATGRAQDLRRVKDELERLAYEVLTEFPAFWVDFFLQVSDKISASEHATRAAPLLIRGRQALDQQHIDDLRSVCIQLWRLLPRDEQKASGLIDVGIRS